MVTSGGVKRKVLKTSKAPVSEAQNGTKKTKGGTVKTKNSNLRIHHAYVHSSLFKDYASVNPLPLPGDKWKIEINFKNNKSVTPVVDNTMEMKKVVKKVLDHQKKYGIKTNIIVENENEDDECDDLELDSDEYEEDDESEIENFAGTSTIHNKPQMKNVNEKEKGLKAKATSAEKKKPEI